MSWGLDVFGLVCFAEFCAKLYCFFVFDVGCLAGFVIGCMHLHEVCVVVRVVGVVAVGWMGNRWWELCRRGTQG